MVPAQSVSLQGAVEMPQFVKNITFASGVITVTYDSGPPREIRVLDFIPALNYEQVDAVKTLTNLIVVLVRTLIAKNVLNEEFLEEQGDLDLDHLIYVFEQIGGSYHDPDISVDNL